MLDCRKANCFQGNLEEKIKEKKGKKSSSFFNRGKAKGSFSKRNYVLTFLLHRKIHTICLKAKQKRAKSAKKSYSSDTYSRVHMVNIIMDWRGPLCTLQIAVGF